MIIGVVGNLEKTMTPEAVRQLVGILHKRGLSSLLHDALLDAFADLSGIGEFVPIEEIWKRSGLVIAFGGDGTMLAAGRMLAGSGIPLLGVNLGKLGFLAEFSVDTLELAINEFFAGECRIVERTLLEATFPENPDLAPLVALNDIVVDKRDGSLLLQIDTVINADYLGTYNADGLIVATPTGSTAYALAVGGPVIVPSARVFVIAPIAPHMLTARPVVVPDTAIIELRPRSHRSEERVRIYADGQIDRYLPMGSSIRITQYGKTVSLVKRTSRTYFDVLRAKLLWGREPILDGSSASAE